MTREKAIQMCMEIKDYLTQGNPIWDKGKVGEALTMAIEALKEAEINCVHCPRYFETEDETGVHSHCGDLISRQDVYCILDKMMVDRPLASDRWVIRDIDKAIKSLPSADRPRGYWIGDKCSVCGEERAWYGSNPPICPDCGADMRPIERSEE